MRVAAHEAKQTKHNVPQATSAHHHVAPLDQFGLKALLGDPWNRPAARASTSTTILGVVLEAYIGEF